MSFKKDDIVVCILDRSEKANATNYGGHGYIPGVIFRVAYITGGTVAWGEEVRAGGGVYFHSIKLATKEEIEHYNKGVRNIADIPTEPVYQLY